MDKRHGEFFVYMLRDKNGGFYTGFTTDIKNRFEQHEKGTGAKFLVGRQPLKIVFIKKYRYYKNALAAERKIKSYTRVRKEELIKIYEKSSAISPIKPDRGGAHV